MSKQHSEKPKHFAERFSGICALVAALIAGIFQIIAVLISAFLSNTSATSQPVASSHIEINNGLNVEGVANDVSVVNSNTYLGYSEFHTEYSDNELLLLADTAFSVADYEKVFDICISEKLQDNPLALYNLGYLYLNGLYVNQDFEKAERYFSLASSVDGDRGLLALAIWIKDYDKITELINQLAAQNDPTTWDYLAYCVYDKSMDELSLELPTAKSEFSYSYNDFYRYEDTDIYCYGSSLPEESTLARWTLAAVDSEDEHIETRFRKQEILYFDLLNRYIEMAN